MDATLLVCVLLGVLQTGHVNSAVTQIPRHRIAKRGETLTVGCEQDRGHNAMYWYRQDPGGGLRLLHYSIDEKIMAKGELPDGYSVSRDEKKRFPLTLESALPNQTALYLCASSEGTVPRGRLLPEHKGPRSTGPAQKARLEARRLASLPPPHTLALQAASGFLLLVQT